MKSLTVYHVCKEPNHHRKEIKSVPNLGIQLEYCQICEALSLVRLCWNRILSETDQTQLQAQAV